MKPHDRARHGAGSPSGGQFASTRRPESDVDLTASSSDGAEPSGIPHPVAWMRAGEARPSDLMSVVRAGLPHREDGLPPTLTREQVREVLARHLPGLYREDLEAHLVEIERSAARWDEMEATDAEDLDPGTVDPGTAHPISLDRLRDGYLTEADAVAVWRDELRDWWAAHTQATIHTAWTHSLQDRAPSGNAVAR